MKFKEINAGNVKQARDVIQRKLDELKAECGLTVDLGKITYEADGTGLRAQLKATPDMDMEALEAIAKENWIKLAPRYGLPEDGFGKVLKEGRRTIRVVGLDPNKPRNPLLFKDVNTGASLKGPVALFHTCEAV